MQVDWNTITALGRTKAVDLWFLFPLGMAVMRVLTRHHAPPPEWEKALVRIYGTHSWKERFYIKNPQACFDCFAPAPGTGEDLIRKADWQAVADYTIERLQTVFHSVHKKPHLLFNSAQKPLFMLCFAAGNEKAAPIAMKIASHLLKP